jgi:hypothetical protein
MAHVGVSLDGDEKERWQEYVEESPHGSISEMVRVAVRKEMQGSAGGGDATIPREMERRIDEMSETQKALESQMQDLSQEFGDVRDVAEPEHPQYIIDLAHDLMSDLPEISREEVDDWGMRAGIQAKELAVKHGAELHEVDAALSYLHENLSHTVNHFGEYHRVTGRKEPAVDPRDRERDPQ